MVLLREAVCVHGQNGFTEGDSVCTWPEWFY